MTDLGIVCHQVLFALVTATTVSLGTSQQIIDNDPYFNEKMGSNDHLFTNKEEKHKLQEDESMFDQGWKFPPMLWMARLLKINSYSDNNETIFYNHTFCGGTLINPQWVLTAAHCLLKSNFNAKMYNLNLKMLYSEYKVEVGGKEYFEVSKHILHPDFAEYQTIYVESNGRLNKLIDRKNDFALIKLHTTSTTEPIHLPYPGLQFEKIDDALILGWDWLGLDRRVVYVYSCFYNTTLCTDDYDSEYQDILGDAGGPLITKQDDGYFIVGVASYTPHKKYDWMNTKFGRYGPVLNVMEWITVLI